MADRSTIVISDGITANNSLCLGGYAAGTYATLAAPILTATPVINNAVATGSRIDYKAVGNLRWSVGRTGDAETGSNAGSDFAFYSYKDDQSYLCTPICIKRDTSTVGINSTLYQAGGYAYLGCYNSGAPVYPRAGNDLGIAWNFSNGLRDVTFWNTDSTPATESFIFRQLTGAATSTLLMKIMPNGSICVPTSVCSPVITGSTKVCSPIVCATSCMVATTCMISADFKLSSDARLKENISSISIAPVNIDYKQFNLTSSPDRLRYGVIAQSLQEQYPELVGIDDDGMLTVSHIDLLVKEVAYLKCRVSELERRL